MHDSERINPGAQIVDNNARALGESLQSADWKRLPHIEHTEEYKARKKSFPSEGDGDERDQLPGDFVDDDELRIFRAVGSGHRRRRGDSDERHGGGRDNSGPDAGRKRDVWGDRRP